MEQTILVTGSNSGFGRLIVETLARQGYRVFAGMRAAAGKNAPPAEELRALAQREQLALHLVEIDVTDDASVEQAIKAIIGATDRLDVVVNNAGVSYSGPLEAASSGPLYDTPALLTTTSRRSVAPIIALMACSTEASSVTSISTRCKASCSRCASARSSSAGGAFFPAAARMPAKTRYP